MRISTDMLLRNSLSGINRSYERFSAAQQQLGTGKRITKPSDDPQGLGLAINMREVQDRIAQYQRNINDARGFMATSDAALGQAVTLVRQARTLGIETVNGSIDPDERAIIAQQVNDIIRAVGNLGNATYGSRYVFGGQETRKPPMESRSNRYVYVGAADGGGADALTTELGSGDYMRINGTADRLFIPAIDALSSLRDSIANGSQDHISREDLTAIDAQLGVLLGARADIGAKVQRLDQARSRHEQTTLTVTALISSIEDADIPKVVVDMTTAELTYQAALASAARGLSQSLLDYLR
ncbi:MAG: flagellar hook-associated protein FlgL [Chthonomonadales bacterium]|nr:flagellar hook-associated protein FlgL [Chthonomonadales bacterium]